jgi:hypothetical protein
MMREARRLSSRVAVPAERDAVARELRPHAEGAPRRTAGRTTAPGTAPLSIAGITAVLRHILANELIRYASVTRLGDVIVSVLPPDRITVGTDEPNQLNVFMYRVTPHSMLRDASSRRADVAPRSGPQIGLDLHYLITAYGAQDFHCEILLGCAVHLLNTTPVLTREMVRAALQSSRDAAGDRGALPAAQQALSSWDIDRLEDIRITPEFMTFEDVSKLWTMVQARYRPSVTYELSTVTMTEAL